MAITIATYKQQLSAQLGKKNAAVPNTVRDTMAQVALNEYCGDNPWKWNWGTASRTFVAGSAALPTDYYSFYEPSAYSYSGTSRTDYFLVDPVLLPSFEAGSNVFAIDDENGTIRCSEAAATFQFRYQKQAPAIAPDGSNDSTVLRLPDLTAPLHLAVGHYWLGSERDEDNYDRFADSAYRRLLRRDILKDSRTSRPNRQTYRNLGDLGWNRSNSVLTER